MPLSADLTRWFKCEDNAANTTVTDATGTQNATSTRNTSAITTAGLIGNAFDFVPASSDRILDGAPPDLSGTTQFGFAQWIYSDSNADTAYVWYTTGAANIFIQQFTDNNVYFQRGGVFGSVGIITGAWTFYVMNYNGATLKGYQNNVEVVSQADANSLSGVGTDVLQWGRRNTSGSLYYNGKMDMIGYLPGRPFTADEMTSMYNAGAGLDYPFTAAGSTRRNLTLLGAG